MLAILLLVVTAGKIIESLGNVFFNKHCSRYQFIYLFIFICWAVIPHQITVGRPPYKVLGSSPFCAKLNFPYHKEPTHSTCTKKHWTAAWAISLKWSEWKVPLKCRKKKKKKKQELFLHQCCSAVRFLVWCSKPLGQVSIVGNNSLPLSLQY